MGNFINTKSIEAAWAGSGDKDDLKMGMKSYRHNQNVIQTIHCDSRTTLKLTNNQLIIK